MQAAPSSIDFCTPRGGFVLSPRMRKNANDVELAAASWIIEQRMSAQPGLWWVEAWTITETIVCNLRRAIVHVTHRLETNSYVRCLIIDLSKAFDTTDNSILLSKFSNFGLPVNILNWIIDFLLGLVVAWWLSVRANLTAF